LQGDALSSFFFSLALECVIRRVQVNEDGLNLNGTHQLLVYDDVNILGGNIRTMKKNTKALVVAITKVRLEVYADETKYMVMSRGQNAG